ncbi:3'-5' exonuclease [Nostocaceae cyanobacterium CENA369]|uniref:3'-5' exonuclease n=1 Tax=Dendronalium phyllosphericum CENA369 TaxID=1725256 RepID=A0A8J7I8K8_9NOST|nr:3'-5' exonuclease [Dendronalium phyllosphericum]MBH8575060.1 3'-5' exonuclease [Dendronalium phyllosphericum CENA369]
MRICILDVETSGLSSEKSEVIEVAALVFSTSDNTILQSISTLIPAKTNEAEKINKIPTSALLNVVNHENYLSLIRQTILTNDLIISHNRTFDEVWIRKLYPFDEIPQWICSATEIKWSVNETYRGRYSLMQLCIDNEIPVWKPHRAYSDCLSLYHVLQRRSDFMSLLQQTIKHPRRLYLANIDFESKDLVKSYGFIWNRLIPQKWAGYCTENELVSFPFTVTPAS